MSEISRTALFGKLNSLAYKAIEGATVFCKMRGNPYVELVHWLQQILQLRFLVGLLRLDRRDQSGREGETGEKARNGSQCAVANEEGSHPE